MAASSARNAFLVLTYLFAALGGLNRGFARSGAAELAVALAFSMGLALALLVWSDARLVGRPLPWHTVWLVFFFWPVAAPIAAVAVRWNRGIGVALAHIVLVPASSFALYWLGVGLAR